MPDTEIDTADEDERTPNLNPRAILVREDILSDALGKAKHAWKARTQQRKEGATMRMFKITVTRPDDEAPDGKLVTRWQEAFESSADAKNEVEDVFGLGVKIEVEPVNEEGPEK